MKRSRLTLLLGVLFILPITFGGLIQFDVIGTVAAEEFAKAPGMPHFSEPGENQDEDSQYERRIFFYSTFGITESDMANLHDMNSGVEMESVMSSLDDHLPTMIDEPANLVGGAVLCRSSGYLAIAKKYARLKRKSDLAHLYKGKYCMNSRSFTPVTVVNLEDEDTAKIQLGDGSIYVTELSSLTRERFREEPRVRARRIPKPDRN